MNLLYSMQQRFKKQNSGSQYRSFWQCIHIDVLLLGALFLLISMGFIILYSASSQNVGVIERQAINIGIATIVMFVFAQIPPSTYQRWAPFLYGVGVCLLLGVLVIGHIKKGGQRWFALGPLHFQPAELMKLAIPMFLAWYCHKIYLPLRMTAIGFIALAVLIPAFLTAKQPDLGTAILLVVAGASVLLLAGLSWRLIAFLSLLLAASGPVIWYLMHDYQRERVLTFLNPGRDPLGSGYHIIQSKLAIGSGGVFGKGWLNGTQSHLHFLPEHATDFIFAVSGEEFGLIGSIILMTLFMLVVCRGLLIAVRAQDTFSRLLAGSLVLTFFMSFFINMGMVTGILPVVGLPLPLVSYGGSSMVTLMASFGILMSIQTHRKLLTT